VLEFSERFHHDQMTEKRRAAVAEAVGRVFGLAVKVQVRMGPGRERESSAEATPESTSRTKIDDVLSFFPGSELEE